MVTGWSEVSAGITIRALAWQFPGTWLSYTDRLVLAGDLGRVQAPSANLRAASQTSILSCARFASAGTGGGQEPTADKIGLQSVTGHPLVFRTVHVGQPDDVVLKPFYQIYYDRYTVYWKVVASEP